MSDTAAKPQPETPPVTDQQPQPEATSGPTREEFDAAQAAMLEWRERCARLQAEFDNSRRRLRKEADEAGDRAVARSVRPFLDQIDNLDRALAAAKPESFAEFAQGVALVRDGLLAALGQTGIVQVAESGAFDPAVHEVIAELPSADAPKGHIVQVHRKGYRLKEQLVRTAQVLVAKPQG
jgi:molecular chaperone GrpE